MGALDGQGILGWIGVTFQQRRRVRMGTRFPASRPCGKARGMDRAPGSVGIVAEFERLSGVCGSSHSISQGSVRGTSPWAILGAPSGSNIAAAVLISAVAN